MYVYMLLFYNLFNQNHQYRQKSFSQYSNKHNKNMIKKRW